MTHNPYLQHLVADPTFGYLFPHRLAIAAFGVPNEYQLRKHLPSLTDGLHYVKIRGNDHVERLFYSLSGLLALSDLINTPQAQAFKADLIQHTQPAGTIVAAPSQSIQHVPANPHDRLYAEPVNHSPVDCTARIPARTPQAFPSDHPLALLTQAITPQLEQAIERSVAARIPSTPIPTPSPQTPQDTAALIFEAQRVANEHAKDQAQTLLEAQRLVANQARPNVQIEIKPTERLNSWLESQDAWALTLIVAGIFAIVSLSAFLLVGSAASSRYQRQPQMEVYR